MAQYKLTADGNTDEFSLSGTMRVNVSGTFGSGTLTLQQEVPAQSGNWVDIENSDKTALADYIFDGVGVGRYRFNLSGSTSPSLTVLAIPGRV